MTDTTLTSYTSKLGITTVPISSAVNTIMRVALSGGVVCLHGDAGIGKTAIMSNLAQLLKAHAFVAKTLSEMQPEDFGIPFADEEDTKYFGMKLPEWIKPIFEAGELGKPSVLFLDEVTRASQSVSTIMFNILTERKIHGHKLPDDCYIVTACNPDTGDYVVRDIMSDFAWRRRMKHYFAIPTVSGWLQYARSEDFHPYVIDYVETHMDSLIDEKARSAGKVYANPAAWHEVSNFLKTNDGLLDSNILAGYINYEMASDFVSFTEDSAYKLPPNIVLTDYVKKAKPIIEKMGKDARGDIVARLIQSVATYIFDTLPALDVTQENLALFWADLDSELKMKMMREIIKRKKASDSNYYNSLFGLLKKNKVYKEHVFEEIRGISQDT